MKNAKSLDEAFELIKRVKDMSKEELKETGLANAKPFVFKPQNY